VLEWGLFRWRLQLDSLAFVRISLALISYISLDFTSLDRAVHARKRTRTRRSVAPFGSQFALSSGWLSPVSRARQ
jgi:hypothetical protein